MKNTQIKHFAFHWLHGKTEYSKGINIEDAAKHLGIGGGALRALDYWEEINELPLEEKEIILMEGEETSNVGDLFESQVREQMADGKDIVTVEICRNTWTCKLVINPFEIICERIPVSA